MSMMKLVPLACCFILLIINTGATRIWDDDHDDDDEHNFGTNYYVGNWTSGTNFTGWRPTESGTFYFGDTLTFTVSGAESVVQVSKEQYDNCKWTFPKTIVPPAAFDKARNVTVFPFPGDNYYISPIEESCKAGLKLTVKVVSRPPAPAPPVYTPKTYTVGDDRGWALGVNYEQWTDNKEFYFGDAFKFVFNASQHSVVEVFEDGFDNCNETFFPVIFGRPEPQSDGRVAITVIPPRGSHYYISPVSNDCRQGLKVKLEIEPTSEAFDHTPAPSPGSGAVAGQDISDGYMIIPRLGALAFLFAQALLFFV